MKRRRNKKGAQTFDPTTLEIYRALYTSVAEEMGIALRRTAFSPNIKERRDYSCALFDGEGRVIAQGDHMPVHLGSMPMAVAAALTQIEFAPGDVVALNDPFAGGTHLPDVTLVAGVYREAEPEKENGRKRTRGQPHSKKKAHAHASSQNQQSPLFYVANRAHHADIGGGTPGSMGMATDVYGEGLRIPPVRIVRGGKLDEEMMRLVLANVRGTTERRADFEAQIGSLKTGAARLTEIMIRRVEKVVLLYAAHLIDYSARLMRRKF
ncbi:MAG: hydantoinase B/oxoprolinase family protein [Acidobacteria bacterium]|nr:hydantoinase B/oxoprolinase family protein [Acidobacteriota bacterium]